VGSRWRTRRIWKDVHDVAERAEEKERARAEDPKPKRPRARERLDKGDAPAGRRPRLGSNGGHAAHAVDDGIDFPVGADAQHHGGCVPPATERIVQREEDEGAEDGFGGATRGDAEHERVQEVCGRKKRGPRFCVGDGRVFCLPGVALRVERLRIVAGWRPCWPREDRGQEDPIYEHPVDEVAHREKVLSKRRVNELVWEQQDCQQRRIAVGLAIVWAMACRSSTRAMGSETTHFPTSKLNLLVNGPRAMLSLLGWKRNRAASLKTR
jgi:hypothetical protein